MRYISLMVVSIPKKVEIFLNHKKKNIKGSTILVISSAIASNNLEIKEAKKLIKIM